MGYTCAAKTDLNLGHDKTESNLPGRQRYITNNPITPYTDVHGSDGRDQMTTTLCLRQTSAFTSDIATKSSLGSHGYPELSQAKCSLPLWSYIHPAPHKRCLPVSYSTVDSGASLMEHLPPLCDFAAYKAFGNGLGLFLCLEGISPRDLRTTVQGISIQPQRRLLVALLEILDRT